MLGGVYQPDVVLENHPLSVAAFGAPGCPDALARALDNPARPFVAIVGGSKVSTKLHVLDTLAEKVDTLIVGGGIANTFIAACGHNVGKSLYEEDLIPEAKRLMEAAREKGGEIPVPTDVVVGHQGLTGLHDKGFDLFRIGDCVGCRIGWRHRYHQRDIQGDDHLLRAQVVLHLGDFYGPPQ